MIYLKVPATLRYRSIVVRTVGSACRLVVEELQDRYQPATEEFEALVISAVGEAFNNVAVHGFQGREPGHVELSIHLEAHAIGIHLRDDGVGYDPFDAAEPRLASLPEGGMGVYIMRQAMDSVSYQFGSGSDPWNTLSLYKRIPNSPSPDTE